MNVKNIGYLGPKGTFSEQAVEEYVSCKNLTADMIPFRKFESLFNGLNDNVFHKIIIPLENSIGGGIYNWRDFLVQNKKLHIIDEVVIPISHCLMSNQITKREQVSCIFSHPQAFLQCKKYIQSKLVAPNLFDSDSTSGAVALMNEDKVCESQISAIIGAEGLAETYNLHIIDKGIEDKKNNQTRFWVLSKTWDNKPTGNDKTSIIFSTQHDRSGILYEILGELANRDINLFKIDSVPTQNELGDYLFFLDCEGHKDDYYLSEALKEIKPMTKYFRVLGSYQKYNV